MLTARQMLQRLPILLSQVKVKVALDLKTY